MTERTNGDDRAVHRHRRDGGTLEDSELIAASMRDGELFSKVYERHAAVLHRYAARRLGADAAEDVVSEAMLAAFRVRHRYDMSRPDARPWLFGVLTREISRRRRTERKHLRHVASMEFAEPAQPALVDQVAVWSVQRTAAR